MDNLIRRDFGIIDFYRFLMVDITDGSFVNCLKLYFIKLGVENVIHNVIFIILDMFSILIIKKSCKLTFEVIFKDYILYLYLMFVGNFKGKIINNPSITYKSQ